jgi:hypothetical protein
MVRLNHDDMKQTKITMETIKEWEHQEEEK